ncbi:glycine cleavage system aminomethyltransferase GcvT [Rhizosaccharibacter radicis]|uniref:aminomethyltransferase n=1 Tax=Rhizosaccharibacter radicis TaxID=2782605 RepID=A0ABT1VVH0_9PROT|nr:glycine cleavage system aminomethyltransferase GcvT [Acetobacteraceae bacterium KSS12]
MSENSPQSLDKIQAPVGRTSLHALHLELGARMVPFAGYDMPLQYPAGIMTEHLHTRTRCGLFDVSHMGQVRLVPRSGAVRDAALALERLVPADIGGLAAGRQRYALLTDDNGGILDDLMVANLGDSLLVVVNAGCKVADVAHMNANLSDACEVEFLEDRALLALQGPEAEAVLSTLLPEAREMRFMDMRRFNLDGQELTVSRSGYTGEDGYEIGLPGSFADEFARRLLAIPGVLPIGLGARDSLRLEAGLCLYGSDLGLDTSPVEAALEWSIQKSRRAGGARAGGYPGATLIQNQLDQGAPRRRVGLRAEGRAPLRGGAPLFLPDAPGVEVGRVSSGAFGPSLQAPVAMGFLRADLAEPGTRLVSELRGRAVAVTVSAMPFVPATYKR